jgi:hypothetical protein
MSTMRMNSVQRAPSGAAALLLAAGLAGSVGCGDKGPKKEAPAEPVSELVVARVSADLSKPDPNAGYWRDVPRGAITLLAQPVITPRPERTTTEQIVVQAAHDGKNIAFRVNWADPEKSEAGRLGEASDALALEFPIKEAAKTLVMMGTTDYPVHIFHWRAQYQRDREQGKPTMASIYPNMAVDMYAMDFKDAPGGSDTDKESFLPGRAEFNPQSYEKTGVDEIIAEGYSTSAVQSGHSASAQGEWKDGRWTLVITRPLAIEGGSTIKAGDTSNIAFAAWQGGEAEVGSRKCVTMAWVPLKVQ